jgi:N-acetylmuramic acid 6-phosphate (MurNAc-6-P) etherase
MDVCGLNYKQAEKLLLRARGNVKLAIVMEETGLSLASAKELIRRSDGFLYRAIGRKPS